MRIMAGTGPLPVRELPWGTPSAGAEPSGLDGPAGVASASGAGGGIVTAPASIARRAAKSPESEVVVS